VKNQASSGRSSRQALSGAAQLPGDQVQGDPDRGQRERGRDGQREETTQAVDDAAAGALGRRPQPHRHVGQAERQQQQPERARRGAGGEIAPPVGLEAGAARAQGGAVLGTRAPEAGLAVTGDLTDDLPVEHVLGRRAGDAVDPKLGRR
jgi:hypothetical protein